MPQTKELELPELDEIIEGVYAVIVWNDDVHSFDYVIDCLIKYADHQQQQAEQCTFLIHFKGKCDVKRGAKEKMKKIHDKLAACGLTTTLEEL
jgi:ATP-dependent Clp protease adaptor protein ClpS